MNIDSAISSKLKTWIHSKALQAISQSTKALAHSHLFSLRSLFKCKCSQQYFTFYLNNSVFNTIYFCTSTYSGSIFTENFLLITQLNKFWVMIYLSLFFVYILVDLMTLIANMFFFLLYLQNFSQN